MCLCWVSDCDWILACTCTCHARAGAIAAAAHVHAHRFCKSHVQLYMRMLDVSARDSNSVDWMNEHGHMHTDGEDTCVGDGKRINRGAHSTPGMRQRAGREQRRIAETNARHKTDDSCYHTEERSCMCACRRAPTVCMELLMRRLVISCVASCGCAARPRSGDEERSRAGDAESERALRNARGGARADAPVSVSSRSSSCFTLSLRLSLFSVSLVLVIHVHPSLPCPLIARARTARCNDMRRERACNT